MYGIGLAVLGCACEFGTWLASLGVRDDGLGCGLAIWERGPLVVWGGICGPLVVCGLLRAGGPRS